MSELPPEAPIAALATAPGPAGVCVVRVSGPGALELGDRLVAGAGEPPSRRRSGTFYHARLRHPATGAPVDDVLVLVSRAPRSYTGEDTLELHGHGGALPSRRLLDAVLAAGARLAEPGAFTRQAFLNGRLDLTQAEAVCDLIRARTERSAQVARAHLDGALGTRVSVLYDRLTACCAELEHLLDFSEEEVPEGFLSGREAELAELLGELRLLADTWRTGHLLRDGALVVLSGPPNAGKSSLLNACLGRSRALVHECPGTTRDAIEETIDLKGVAVRLVDTAGLRETDEPVERAGIERTLGLLRQADVNVRLIDGSAPWPEAVTCGLDAARTVYVLTKGDLEPCAETLRRGEGLGAVRVSALTGEGLDAFREAVAARLGLEGEACEAPVVSLRQEEELRRAAAETGAAAAALAGGPHLLVIAANHLRQAAEAAGRLVGRVYSDDLLDAVFSRFCVGK